MSSNRLIFLNSDASKGTSIACGASGSAPVNYYYRRNAAQRAKHRARLGGRRR